jgi:hypothetical protein
MTGTFSEALSEQITSLDRRAAALERHLPPSAPPRPPAPPRPCPSCGRAMEPGAVRLDGDLFSFALNSLTCFLLWFGPTHAWFQPRDAWRRGAPSSPDSAPAPPPAAPAAARLSSQAKT